MKINDNIKQELRDVVAASFETGHFSFETYQDFRREYPIFGKEAWEYYCELVNLGPAGFYEEFKDEYDFDPMFIQEYAPYYNEEDKFSSVDYAPFCDLDDEDEDEEEEEE